MALPGKVFRSGGGCKCNKRCFLVGFSRGKVMRAITSCGRRDLAGGLRDRFRIDRGAFARLDFAACACLRSLIGSHFANSSSFLCAKGSISNGLVFGASSCVRPTERCVVFAGLGGSRD